METNVCALIVEAIRNISSLWKYPPKLNSAGELSVAPVVTMDSTSNYNVNMKLVEIKWTKQSQDGLFGTLKVGGETFKVVTNLAKRIQDGVYEAVIDLSPHLHYLCPHLRVPLRDKAAGGDAGLRIHIADLPSQSLGCIFPGESIDGDAVDNSKTAFEAIMRLLPGEGHVFHVAISSSLAS